LLCFPIKAELLGEIRRFICICDNDNDQYFGILPVDAFPVYFAVVRRLTNAHPFTG